MQAKLKFAVIVSSLMLAVGLMATVSAADAAARGRPTSSVRPEPRTVNVVGHGILRRTISTAYPEAYPRGLLENALLENYPAIYGGTDLINNGTQIAVYLTNVPTTMSAFVSKYVSPSVVQYVTVAHTLNELNGISDSIGAAYPTLQSEGIDITATQLDFSSSTVVVNVLDPTSADIAQLNQQFGSVNLTIVSASSPNPSPWSTRDNDVSPFNGGDNMLVAAFSGGQPQCTSGFGISIGSNDDIITAGHCFPPGDAVYNEICLSGYCSTSGHASMGGLDANDGTLNGTDSGVVNGNGSAAIWGGVIGSPARLTVVGNVGVTQYEDDICTSGAMDGEICSLEVTSDPQNNKCETIYEFNSDYSMSGHHLCHLIVIKNNDSSNQGGVVAGQGDSGGPVFVLNQNGQVLGTGTITGPTPIDPGIACPANKWRGIVCGATGYYSALSIELHDWGATLNKG